MSLNKTCSKFSTVCCHSVLLEVILSKQALSMGMVLSLTKPFIFRGLLGKW